MRALALLLLSTQALGDPPESEVEGEVEVVEEAATDAEEVKDEEVEPEADPVEDTTEPEPPKNTLSVDITAQQESVSDLKYNLAGLEWFLGDKEAYKKHCPLWTWVQPPIGEYTKEPKSYLPEG